MIPLVNTQPWAAEAACRGLAPTVVDALFFPEEGHRHPTAAREMCLACPVSTQCAAFGAREEFGMWGGTTPRTRGTRRHGRVA